MRCRLFSPSIGSLLKLWVTIFFSFLCLPARSGAEWMIREGSLLEAASGELVALTGSANEPLYAGDSRVLTYAPLFGEWRLFTREGLFLGAVSFDRLPADTIWQWKGDLQRKDGEEWVPVDQQSFTPVRKMISGAREPLPFLLRRVYSTGNLVVELGEQSLLVRAWDSGDILHAWNYPWRTSLHSVVENDARFLDATTLLLPIRWQWFVVDLLDGTASTTGLLGSQQSAQCPDGHWLTFTPENLVLLSPDGQILDSLDRVEWGLQSFPVGGNDPFQGLGGEHARVQSNQTAFVRWTGKGELLPATAPGPVEDISKIGARPFLPDWWYARERSGDGYRYDFYHYSESGLRGSVSSGERTFQTVGKGNAAYLFFPEKRVVLGKSAAASFRVEARPLPSPPAAFNSLRMVPLQPPGSLGFRAVASTELHHPQYRFLRIHGTVDEDLTAFHSTSHPGQTHFFSFGTEAYWHGYGMVSVFGRNWINHPRYGALFLADPVTEGAWAFSEKAGWFYLPAKGRDWLYSPAQQSWVYPASKLAAVMNIYDSRWEAWDDTAEGHAPAFWMGRRFEVFKGSVTMERWEVDRPDSAYATLLNSGDGSGRYQTEFTRTGPDTVRLQLSATMGAVRLTGTYSFAFTSASGGSVVSELQAFLDGEEISSESDTASFRLLLPE